MNQNQSISVDLRVSNDVAATLSSINTQLSDMRASANKTSNAFRWL